MRMMYIYRYKGSSYGDGIILIDPKIVNENNYNLHHKSFEWEFIGQQDFNEKILKQLDKEKTLDTYGLIDLFYID